MLESRCFEQIGLKVERLTPIAFLCLLPAENRLDISRHDLECPKEDEDLR